MQTRTDIHRPSAMNPRDYSVLAYACVFPEWDEEAGREIMVCEMEPVSDEWEALGRPMVGTWMNSDADGGKCDHCGAAIKYACIVKHNATGDLLAIGRQCINRFFSLDWSQMEASAQTRRRHEQNWNKFTAAHPAAVESLKWAGEGDGRKKSFCLDLYEKAILKGYDLSEKQVAVLTRIHAEANAPVTYAAGRREIVGTIVKASCEVDTYASNRNYTAYKWTVTVQTAEGFKVHGSLPSDLSPFVSRYAPCEESAAMLKGVRIRFTATIEPKDAGFATYKRPTSAAYLSESGEAVTLEQIETAYKAAKEAARVAAKEAEEAARRAETEYPADDAGQGAWLDWAAKNGAKVPTMTGAEFDYFMAGVARASVLMHAENPMPAESADLAAWKAWRRFWTLKAREDAAAFGTIAAAASALYAEWETRNDERLNGPLNAEAVAA
jgi:hypothetical protein